MSNGQNMSIRGQNNAKNEELPEVELPEVELPEVELPEVEFPEVEFPEVEPLEEWEGFSELIRYP